MAYNSQQDQVILFGGFVQNAPLNDTLGLGDSSTWQQITSFGVRPLARVGHAMAYDSQRSPSYPVRSPFGENSSFQNDTWVWDGSLWRQITPSGTVPPSSRQSFAIGL